MESIYITNNGREQLKLFVASSYCSKSNQVVGKYTSTKQIMSASALLSLGLIIMLSGFRIGVQSFRTSSPLLTAVPILSSKIASTRNLVVHLSMSSDLAPVRVRFAPSPTGSLHVGGARTALFNWLLARKSKGKFIVRVEDTDEARSTRDSEKAILDDLKWLNMQWDEGPEVEGPHGPYRQSERKAIYKKIADQLIEEGFAYRCFCTEEELEAKRLAAEEVGEDPKYDGEWRDADPEVVKQKLADGAPHTVRFRVPPGKIVSIDDAVRGKVTWDAEACLGDFIILRSNGMPVYNFCVSVDDVDMRITHVIRAEEHLSNTLRQMLIMEALKFTPPIYAHCSLILGSDKSKLSKRHGATSVKQFSEQGFVPEAMINYLANLGWNDGTDKEIYTPKELIQAFSVDRIVKSAAVFDMTKLMWVNAQHLRSRSAVEIEPIVLNVLASVGQGSGVKVNEEDVTILPQSVLSGSPSVGSGHSEAFRAFLAMATKIAQRDMDLTIDAPRLVGNCLQYKLDETLRTDEDVGAVVTETLQAVIDALVVDYDSGAMPRGVEPAEDFPTLWKAYMKGLGKQLGLKGKGLFHPVRLLLTGRMSGPDVGDQIRLLALSEGQINPAYRMVSLAQRINSLRDFSIQKAAETIASVRVASTTAAEST